MATRIELLTIYQVADCELGNFAVGELDYGIHSALSDWLSHDMVGRLVGLVEELRALASNLESGESPFTVTLEFAAERAAKNAAAQAERAARYSTPPGETP